jgi:hypothetical protein
MAGAYAAAATVQDGLFRSMYGGAAEGRVVKTTFDCKLVGN